MPADIILKQKEQKIIKFTYKNATTKEIIPLTGATFILVIFKDNTPLPIITKNDTDFDKSDAVDGKVRITLTEIDLTLAVGTYNMQIKTVFSNGEIDFSNIFSINITKSLFS